MKYLATFFLIIFFCLKVKFGNAQCYKSITSGAYCTYGIQADGTIWAWGFSGFIISGGNQYFGNVPVKISNETDWKYISAG
jgi:hypothetical protein